MIDQQIAQAHLSSQRDRFPLSGVCDGRFALTLVDAVFLQRLLPPELELAPNEYSQPGRHPLMLMFDKVTLRANTNLERIAALYHLRLELNYNEFIVMLPYVQFKDSRYGDEIPYCFLPVLYLDDPLAVIGGRVFWEFNKLLTSFAIGASTYEVKDILTSDILLSSTGTMDGDPVPGNDVPNFVAITPILDLPVVEYGRLGYVSSIYKVEYQNQIIRPSSIRFSNQSSIYLPPGSLAIPSIRENVLGCFDMIYNWKLSFIKFIPKP